jgi:hypothetical protein
MVWTLDRFSLSSDGKADSFVLVTTVFDDVSRIWLARYIL